MNLNPYLVFRDTTREALEFYQSVFGGTLEFTTFGAFPDMGHGPDEDDLVLHGRLTTPDGLVLMASDTPASMPYREPEGISISYNGDDVDAVRTVWNQLSEGAQIGMELSTPAWGGLLGMLTDRFGVPWMLGADL